MLASDELLFIVDLLVKQQTPNVTGFYKFAATFDSASKQS